WMLRYFILLPWAAPIALTAIGFVWFYDPQASIFTWFLVKLHIVSQVNHPTWLGTPTAAMSSIITVQAWRTIPFATVIFLAGIASIPQEVDDAAAIDGATGIRKFWYVSLPLQLPIAIVAILFGIVFTATDMIVPFILTNGGPFNSTQVLTTWAFQTGINSGNIGEGAAIALFMLPVLAVVSVGMLIAFPFAWMAITSLKNQAQVYDPTKVWSFHPTLAAYGYLFHHTDYLRWLRNSAFVGLVVVLITLAVALPAGYALARLAGRIGRGLGVAIFLTYLVPPTLLFLPLSRLVSELHLSDRLWALILIYPSFTIPFAIWLLMGFFKTIPQELEDAALVDGCSRLQALVRIVFPISVPGILTVVIFTFSLVVNEFVYAITFISSSTNRTLTVGVPTDLIRGDLFNWPGIMAAILIPSIPLALVYNAFLNRFIAGFTGGAFR